MSGTTSADTPSGDSRDGATASNVERAADYGSLPLSFEANQGQTDPQVQFLTRGAGHSLFLTPSAAVLTMLQRSDANPERSDGVPTRDKPLGTTNTTKQSVVRMTFEGADPHARVVGVDPLPGVVNYLIGADASKWRTNVPTYQKVAYENVYPGIDLVYYGSEGQLEYDLIVAPGADPHEIALTIQGAEKISVDDHGDLVLTLSRATADAVTREVQMHKPVVYQMGDHGDRQLLAGTYVLVASDASPRDSVAVDLAETIHTVPPSPRVAFQVASYDATKPLIIDPVLSWSTYLGGTGEDDAAGIALDQAGNVYVSGYTRGPDFPIAGSLIQNTPGGGTDVFVTKINAAGTAVIYSTYFGGSGDESAAIAVDQAGQVYLAGATTTPGSGFPGAVGSLIQNTYGGGDHDAFVTKLNATGTGILYSTYLGGSDDDYVLDIAVDVRGCAYVTGYTQTPGSGFPGTANSPIQSTFGGGGGDAFVTKINSAGTALEYSTYLGGNGGDVGVGIAVDQAGSAYVAGRTERSRTGFPGTAGSLIQSTPGDGAEAFVTKLDAGGTAIVYSTYLGGSGGEGGYAIALDRAGNAYITGSTTTSGSGFPGAGTSLIQNTFGGGSYDSFVTKLNASGTAIVYSTYLGGSGEDESSAIAVDAAGNAYVTGYTTTQGSGFPGTAGSPIQSTYGGGRSDAFVTKLNAAGTAIVYSTYLGGMGLSTAAAVSEGGAAIAVDPVGNAYVTGRTETPGSEFPGTASSLIQSTYGGGADAFVAKITSSVAFARFRPTTNIDLRPVQGKDWFDTFASFTLGADSNGVAPLKEPVIIQIGTFSITIPAGSFKLKDGDPTFVGRIDGVKLYARIHQIKGKNYEFWTYANCASLVGTKNPVRVVLAIGDDSGSATVTAKFGSRPS